ncbi:MAG: hypothetical protein WBG08_11995 [Litorimonas sp.]
MRPLLPLFLLTVAACVPQRADVGEKTFETFEAGGLQLACTFYPADAEIEDVAPEARPLLFATLRDDPSNEARVRYGGERLRLVPRQELDATGVPLDTVYAVIDYTDYDVRVQLSESEVPGTYAGMLEMPGLAGPTEIKGSCAV